MRVIDPDVDLWGIRLMPAAMPPPPTPPAGTAPVATTLRDGVLVITLDNPPVNGLGAAIRAGVVDAIEQAQRDDAVRAIVITGANGVFSGGADIREFGTPQMLQAPTLHGVIAAVEDSTKPVVIAINGIALGGGLELSLGAHYRVAARDAQVGLPEVKIGLLPGAGGTQRLPRAVGLETALNMIVSGSTVRATDLASTRLFDRVVDGDVVDAAVAFAAEVAARPGPLPRVRDWTVEHPNAEGFLGFARNAIAAASANYPAPLKCLDAVAASVGKPFEEGLLAERDGFVYLMNTNESKALRHAFFAERAASKVAGIGADLKARAIARVGVVGAGTMGGGISMNFLNSGIPVTIVERQQEALLRGVATIRANYEASAKKGKLNPEQVEERMALLTPTLDFGALADVDLIVEAVFEDYAVKEAVFRELDGIAKPGAILASNTSTLDVDRIAAFTQRPCDVVGMHFFSPANVMKLLEVVRGANTAKDTLLTALAIGKKIGKVGVVSGVCDGFIGNRMIEQYGRQGGFLLDEGATPQQVDRAMEKFGMAMGPFRMGDLAGNDIGWAIRKRRYVERPEMIYSKTADLLCEMGRFGQKVGKGWYDYTPGERNAQPSAEVEAMIARYARERLPRQRRCAVDNVERRFRLIHEPCRQERVVCRGVSRGSA